MPSFSLTKSNRFDSIRKLRLSPIPAPTTGGGDVLIDPALVARVSLSRSLALAISHSLALLYQALVFIFSKPSSSSLNFDKAELKAPIYSFAQLSLFAAIFFYYELKHNIPHTHTHMSIYMYTTSKFHNSLKDVKA